MTNPRHLFVLIGFLAQALTWESYIFAAVATGLWVLAVTLLHNKFRVPVTTEAVALVIGCLGSIALSRTLQRSAHFFLGDGLILLQLVRLVRPLTRREKLTSLVIASFHFGVLCTLAPNMRFIILFLGAVYFFPGALKETFHHPDDSRIDSHPPELKFLPSMRVCLWLVLGSVFVFITFPRFTGSSLQLREGFSDQGSLLDTILDPRRGGRANSQQVLLQIEGANVGYLRYFALTEFDGERWWADTKAKLMMTPWTNKVELTGKKRFLSRKVFIKTSRLLGKIVPVDGRPLHMEQTFFTHPFRNVLNDALECNAMWTTANNTYEYFIDTDPSPAELQPEVRQRLIYAPPQSTRLKSWLEKATSKGTNALHKARILELHLRNNFRYELGTPELSRLSPTEDFIFNRQEGHCERFAASMALFLRMQGIPSRVAIGYVPVTKNLFTGRLQVRFCDAHSWTEGYFDDVGWVKFDATPGPPPGGHGSDFLDMMEELDFAWYSHIVNFNGFAQRDLAAGSVRLLANIPAGVWTTIAWALTFLLVLCLAVKLGLGRILACRLPWKKYASTPAAVARHYYEEMLHSFRRRGIAKSDEQTPIEFLHGLRDRSKASYNDAALVTGHFCHSFYGEKSLTAEERSETEQALNRIKSAEKHESDHGSQRR